MKNFAKVDSQRFKNQTSGEDEADPEVYNLNFKTFTIFQAAISVKTELELTLKRKLNPNMMSEQLGIELDSARKRLKRSRSKVRQQAVIYMKRKYEEDSLVWDIEEEQ